MVIYYDYDILRFPIAGKKISSTQLIIFFIYFFSGLHRQKRTSWLYSQDDKEYCDRDYTFTIS